MATSPDNPVVIGLYGLPGAGYSTMLNELQDQLGTDRSMFFEGAEMIDDLVKGDLEVFKSMDATDQIYDHGQAITTIAKRCTETGKAGVVTGHFAFLGLERELRTSVWTAKDQETYTHILYLNLSADVVSECGRVDPHRSRPPLKFEILSKWPNFEKEHLRRLCYENGMLFSPIDDTHNVINLISDFRTHN